MNTTTQARQRELARQEELSRLLDQRFKLQAEESLASFFANVAWPAVEGDRKLELTWPLLLLAKNAQATMEGNRVNRWIVNLAVRCGKSTLLSVALPCWWWLKNPAYKWTFYSYGDKLRRELARKREKVLRSEQFQKHWGDRVRLPARTSLENLTNSAGGEFQLLGPGATGHGGDGIIIDDPTSGRQARFEHQLATQEEHVRESIFSRLNNRTGPIIVVQQRQDPEDLSGRLSTEEGWHTTAIPAIFEEDTTLEAFDGTKLRVAKGTLTDPIRFSKENLDEMRRRMGRRAFEAGILQKPPTGEEIVKREWLKPYDPHALPWRDMMDAVIISVDTASVGTKGHSRWGITVWGVKAFKRTRDLNGVPVSEWTNGYFLLATATRHCEYTEAKRITIRLAAEHRAHGVWIEAQTQGHPLAQELQRTGVTGVRLININKDGKKTNRLWAATSAIEDGRVYIPTNEAGEEFLKDLLRCRKKLPENDPAWDSSDSCSLFLNEAERNGGISALFQLKNWAALSSITGSQDENDKPWPLGYDPHTPKGYVHLFDFKRAAQNLLPEKCGETLYGMTAPDGKKWDVSEDECETLLAEGWTYEGRTQAETATR